VNGSLTQEQAKTLLHHSNLKTAFAIWDETEGSAPDNERTGMEDQAARFRKVSRATFLVREIEPFCFLGQKQRLPHK
jgi:hypothetical protein